MMGLRVHGYGQRTLRTSSTKIGTKLATVTDSTNYLDAARHHALRSTTVSCVLKGTEGAQSAAVTAWAQNYTSIPLTSPGGSYSASDGSVGDLDGDASSTSCFKWDPSDAKDNSQSGNTSTSTSGRLYVGRQVPVAQSTWDPTFALGRTTRRCQWAISTATGRQSWRSRPAPGTKDGTGAYLSTGPAA